MASIFAGSVCISRDMTAPASISVPILSALRFLTVTSWPALTRLPAMAPPIWPSPINPISMTSLLLGFNLGERLAIGNRVKRARHSTPR